MDLLFLITYGLVHNIMMHDHMVNFTKEQLIVGRDYMENCTLKSDAAWKLNRILIFPLMPADALLNLRCSARPVYDECVNSLNNRMRVNLNATQINALKYWRKIDSDILDHSCDKIEMFKNMTQEGTACSRSSNKALKDCSVHLTSLDNVGFYEIPEFQQRCSDFEKFETCMKTSFAKICPPNVNEYIGGILRAIISNICPKNVV
ncbi:uncharacterized protein LOC130900588 [Diorhabda carinulata]|uniref:uncharacterized protein LOC130900588 n=1 Tax=Diorhabda carinulata TaxID=1163345 RepID=UPI0025A04783|nr:uncharacterized protein LOC130900588 [Diorhabda carinulata]